MNGEDELENPYAYKANNNNLNNVLIYIVDMYRYISQALYPILITHIHTHTILN